jgi:hypothetical protein
MKDPANVGIHTCIRTLMVRMHYLRQRNGWHSRTLFKTQGRRTVMLTVSMTLIINKFTLIASDSVRLSYIRFRDTSTNIPSLQLLLGKLESNVTRGLIYLYERRC